MGKTDEEVIMWLMSWFVSNSYLCYILYSHVHIHPPSIQWDSDTNKHITMINHLLSSMLHNTVSRLS